MGTGQGWPLSPFPFSWGWTQQWSYYPFPSAAAPSYTPTNSAQGPPFLHIKRDVFKMGETMACVRRWDDPGKRGREMLGEEGAAVRTDQPPTTTTPAPLPPHRHHRGQACQGGSGSRAQEGLLGPVLGKGGSQAGQEREKVTQGPRES